MAVLTLDYADARNRMVDGQLRPNRVGDPRLLAAMRALPRERFLPPALRERAYVDEDVPLGGGRVLMAPLVLARMVQLAAPRGGERALVIGAGTGYGAALLASCGAVVTGLEESPQLVALAEQAAPAGVKLVSGPLTDGWPADAPYDLIIIEGAVPSVPPAIAAQLRQETGRLMTALIGHGRSGSIVIGERTGSGLTMQPKFDCATAVLPSFLPPQGFVF